jgi:hypothetical protein
MATATEAQTTNSASISGPNLVQASTASSVAVSTTDQVPSSVKTKPAVVVPCIWIIIFIIFIAGICYVVYKIVQCIKCLGKKINPPPSTNEPPAIMIEGMIANASSSFGLVTNSYPVTGGSTTNNSVATMLSGLLGVPSGAGISTLSSGIAVYQYQPDIPFTDTYLGIQYTGGFVYNYSIQYSSSLANTANWHTLYTAVGWTGTGYNGDPWICQVTYTNLVTAGVTNGWPVSTNWVHAYVDYSRLQVTNVDVISKGIFTPCVTPISSQQFYRFCCNTNNLDPNYIPITGP